MEFDPKEMSELLSLASGNALKLASSLGNLDSNQLAAAQSAMNLQRAQKALASAEESGNIAARDAALDNLKRMQIGEAMRAAKAHEAAAKAKAAADEKAARDAEASAKRAADEQAKAAKDAADAQKAARTEAVNALKNPIDTATKALEGMGPKGAAAAMAIKAAFAIATTAIMVTVGALYEMAKAATEVIAQRAKLLATFGALSFGSAGGAKTLAIVEKLGVQLPFATAKIAEWATGLQKAGFQGKALESALRAIGSAEALIEGGGAAAQNLFETLGKGGAAALQLVATLKRGGPEARSQLADMGLRVQDVAAALGMTVAQFQRANLSAKQMAVAVEKALAKKAAGPLADLFLTFPVLIQKVREGFMSLFDKMGPSVRAFMKAVKGLFGEFFKGGGAINALKPIVTAVLTTLFSWATRAVTAIHGIVKAFTNAGKAGGMFSGVIAVAKTVFGFLVGLAKMVAAPLMMVARLLMLVFSNALVLQGLKTIFTVIAVVIGSIVAAVGLLVAAFTGIISVVVSVAGVLAGLVTAAYAAAAGIVDGLVGGIDIGAFVEKMAGMAAAGLTAFKQMLGIASPSKVMAEMGGHTVAGFSQGVDQNADKAQESMDSMVSPKAGKGGAKGKGGMLAEHIHFHYSGPADEAESFFEKAEAWLKQLSLEAPEPVPAGGG